MSAITQIILVERYGFRLNTEQLAEVLSVSPGTVRNKISARNFEIPTYVESGRRFADSSDVAAYLNARAAEARASHAH